MDRLRRKKSESINDNFGTSVDTYSHQIWDMPEIATFWKWRQKNRDYETSKTQPLSVIGIVSHTYNCCTQEAEAKISLGLKK